ncbi:DUF1310 family protein [Bifidobacterium sp. ESL0798]|uniref:DUF1310 family protein n=1 Tax=Bifidobacterium sp. ESL0798 TaxID=2983235 RepID=UPI0023F734F8|nr:DUF1310 family protein [Bifidobacterium sp. ESL0798]WEV73966.1 DUF1310 family protein [Bifidobacterium sp. ESL0798]
MAAGMQRVRGNRGGKIALIVVACVLAVAVAIGGIVAKYHNDQEQWMHDVVYSKEADKIYRNIFKYDDPNAFTENGKIHTYQVDDKSVRHNPMGGINLTLYVNHKDDLYVYVTLNKNGGSGPLEDSVGGYSRGYSDLIGAES